MPVISVCGAEILMEKFDIQKLVVYATDLDEKIPVAPVLGPLGLETVKSRIGIKKLNPFSALQPMVLSTFL